MLGLVGGRDGLAVGTRSLGWSAILSGGLALRLSWDRGSWLSRDRGISWTRGFRNVRPENITEFLLNLSRNTRSRCGRVVLSSIARCRGFLSLCRHHSGCVAHGLTVHRVVQVDHVALAQPLSRGRGGSRLVHLSISSSRVRHVLVRRRHSCDRLRHEC